MSKTTRNSSFASGGMTRKFGSLFLHTNSLKADSFVLRTQSSKTSANTQKNRH
jgi:hypothetical protein